MENPNFTPPSVKPLTSIESTTGSTRPIGAGPRDPELVEGSGSTIGPTTGQSTRENQENINRRVDPRGNPVQGSRLAEENRPKAPGITGAVGKKAKGKAMKWAMAAAFGGTIGAGGLIGYFLS